MNKHLHDYRQEKDLFQKQNYFVTLLANLIVILCTMIVVCFIAFQLVYDNAPVVGQSMYPTLNITGADTDRVYINKYAKLHHGDIVVLSIENWSESESKNIIKRVIGLAGDRISFEQDRETLEYYVTRNGERIDENYLASYQDNIEKYEEFERMCMHSEYAEKNSDSECYTYIVPKDKVFVLGDNRANSIDSAVRGAFPLKELWGRVDYKTPKEVNYVTFFFRQFLSLGIFKYGL